MVWVAARHADHPSAAGAVRYEVKGDCGGEYSLPMFAMHVWSEPSLVGPEAASKKCSRALASRCLAGCRSIQTTTASNCYIQLLALAPKARPLGLYFKNRPSTLQTPYDVFRTDSGHM